MADLVFAENERPAEKGNHDASATDSGYKRNHRPLITKSFEVSDIGNGQQSPDKEDTPAPSERSVFLREPATRIQKGQRS